MVSLQCSKISSARACASFQIVGAKKEAQALAEHILEHCKDTTTLSMADAVLKAQEESISPHDLQAKQCQHMNKEAYVH